MLEKLLKNPEKYFWSINNDGDLVLGNADLGLKAKLTLTLTNKWINLAPLVESSPGNYIGQSETFMKNTKEYELVAELYKLIKAQLKEPTLIEREKTTKNTYAFLLKYYQETK
ncbi:hypothetical protein [Labilibaculum manganireducens]|uniref:hypothetical protein n=1 Tax=Labilibaculum manganireducens TaxID=1940525 RepID=UPI0029F50681|nr:hypothetical protein [Labilibaculum manganireducens]